MNIIVNLYGGGLCCRPDTTWERENRDLYSPDFISGYLYTPVLFAKIAKAGKCIGGKFAERYYDSVGYGMLLYPADLIGDACGQTNSTDSTKAESCQGKGLAWASCMDHTSILPFPMFNRITLDSPDNVYRILLEGKEIYSTSCGSVRMIEKAISEASRYVSLRIGDMIAIELAAPGQLVSFVSQTSQDTASGKSSMTEIRATFCDNEVFDFRIIK